MARGFSTTYGSGTTDYVETSLTGGNSVRSYSMWLFRNGDGGNNNGRIFDTNKTTGREVFSNVPGGSTYTYVHVFNTTNGTWTMSRPATGAWHQIGLTYDNTSTSNNPAMYLDGSSVTVTTSTAPVGTASTSTDPYGVGNRPSDKARVWDGMIAEWAVWNVILSAGEMAALGAGFSPLLVRPQSLVSYCPMVETSNIRDWFRTNAPTVTGTLNQPHPGRIIYPSRRRLIIPAAAAPAGNAEFTKQFALLGVG